MDSGQAKANRGLGVWQKGREKSGWWRWLLDHKMGGYGGGEKRRGPNRGDGNRFGQEGWW